MKKCSQGSRNYEQSKGKLLTFDKSSDFLRLNLGNLLVNSLSNATIRHFVTFLFSRLKMCGLFSAHPSECRISSKSCNI